jgi:spore maturation protein CgeB/GT2 family glycosyltransferase
VGSVAAAVSATPTVTGPDAATGDVPAAGAPMSVAGGQELALERRVAHLERELLIRDREERAARREMARVTEQLMRHSRAARTQLERARAEGAAALDAASESAGAELQAQLQAERERGGAAVEAARVQAAATIAAAREELRVERERAGGLQEEANQLRNVLAAATAEARELSAERSEQDSLLQQLRGELDRAEDERQAARAQLESALRERARERAEHSARARRLEQSVSALSVGLSQTRDDIARAAGSRAWRLGHLITRTLSRIARRPVRTKGALVAALARIDRVQSAVRSESVPGALGAAGTVAAIGPGAAPGEVAAGAPAAQIGPGPLVLTPDPPAPQLRLSPAQERELERRRTLLAANLRERLGPPPERERWPSVSAIVPTRDGLGHLRRLFAGLTAHTRYPELEVVVVDNASSDGTLDYLESLQTPFPVHVVANEENLSYAQANARGVERASGELLLFLNNDIEPFEPGWLKELVAALESEGVGAVGATLLHPEDLDGLGSEVPDGLGSKVPHEPRSDDPEVPPAEAPEGSRSQNGEPPVPEPLVQHRTIRFRWQDGMVKGFNDGDGEGLWEGAFGSELRAPAVTAACMLIAREHFERVGGFGAGYRYGTEDVDLGLKLLVSGAESAGVGRAVLFHRESSSQNRASRDFRRLNRLENRRLFLECWGPQTLREYRLARLRSDPFWTDGSGAHVAITLTSLDVADGWGDWYSGHEIGDALEAIGWRVTYVERKGDHWYELPEDLDYVLSLMDPFDLRRVPEHVSTIAWIRNWTERWLERPWFERADVLLASSQGSAELIEARTGRRTIRFPLAVNPARFHPRPAEERFVCDYAFTGNWWGKDRDIQRALAPREGERLTVYGKDWEQVAELAPYARGELPYQELALLYPSAKLVLDDTQGPTLPYGAVNARVFDALAAGTLVVTNCESGVRELFDEEFPVWSSREDLRAALDELLGDDARRAALTARYRETVLTRHTYAHRAAQLREILLEHEQRLSFCLKIGAPNRAVAPTWGDLHFAESLARELRRRGHRTLIQTLDEWEDEAGLTYDVVVHLKGLSRFHPKPGQFNVLWSISHPAELTGEECDGYDLIAVASPLFAERLRERTGTPVVVLEQAADPWVMRPDPTPELAHELVYVANSRNVLRPIARDLLPTERDLAIWGTRWEGLIDTSRVIAEHLPNDELHRVYSSAGIVLNDHWDDMREYGYISNRIYDALACGALVLSDDVPGLHERFGDAVAVYRDAEELRELVERLLADPAERRRRAERGREVVLGEHTFAHRVTQLLEVVQERVREPMHARRLRAAA